MSGHPHSGGAGHRGGTFLAAGAVTALLTLGLGGLYYARARMGGEGGGGGQASRPSSDSQASAPTSPSTASSSAIPIAAVRQSQAKLLARLERTLEVLRGGVMESDVELPEELGWSSSGTSAGAGGVPVLAPSASLRPTSVERVLRDIRQQRWKRRGAVRHGREEAPLPITLTHRLRMAQLIGLYHQRLLARSSSSVELTPRAAVAAAKQRREDYELCWALLYGHAEDPNEPGASSAAASTIGYDAPLSSAPPHAHPFATAPFPPASLEGEAGRTLLEVALELRDPQRMWLALQQLLQLSARAVSPTPAASSVAGVSPSPAVPEPLSPSLLLSLDRTSLFVAFDVASLLGCWLWSYQLAHRLFGAARAALTGDTLDDDLYEQLHARALADAGSTVDLAVVSEIATLRVLAALGRYPHLLDRMQLSREHIAPAVLPFDEQGRVVDGGVLSVSPRSPPAALASLGGVEQPACWESWEVCAYSTVVKTVVAPDERGGRASVMEQLEQEQAELPVHYCHSSLSATSSLMADVPLGPARSIHRHGRLFSMTGLFQQPIPLVGTLIAEPAILPAEPAHTMPGTTFSVQGYTHVRSRAEGAAAAVHDEFDQFEFYSLTTGNGLNRSGSSGNGITNSMVDAASGIESSPPVPASGLSTPPLPMLHSGSYPPSAPDSPPSAHLFASASFTSLSGSGPLREHFPAPRRTPSPDEIEGDDRWSMSAQAADPAGAAGFASALPPLATRHPSSFDSLSSPPLSPEPFAALDRYASALPAGSVDMWHGVYRVIQAPRVTAGQPPGGAVPVPTHSARPRVEVWYEIRVCTHLVTRNGAEAHAAATM